MYSRRRSLERIFFLQNLVCAVFHDLFYYFQKPQLCFFYHPAEFVLVVLTNCRVHRFVTYRTTSLGTYRLIHLGFVMDSNNPAIRRQQTFLNNFLTFADYRLNISQNLLLHSWKTIRELLILPEWNSKCLDSEILGWKLSNYGFLLVNQIMKLNCQKLLYFVMHCPFWSLAFCHLWSSITISHS